MVLIAERRLGNVLTMEPTTSEHRIVIPGEQLYDMEKNLESGPGTYSIHGHIHASLAGTLHKVPPKEGSEIWTVEVRRKEGRKQTVVPEIGSVVTAKVETINARFCKVSILCVADSVLSHQFSGQIRREDVVDQEKDKVEIHASFRPTDVILARVISMGDSQISYQLTTAEDELGVVSAKCQQGCKMKRVSWKSVECAECNIVELRKLAKVPEIKQS